MKKCDEAHKGPPNAVTSERKVKVEHYGHV